MPILCYSFPFFLYILLFYFLYVFLDVSLTHSLLLTIVSKKFQLDISVVRARELNFVLRSEIFVHYDGQLRASHLILGCVPSYTSYQDSSSALIVGSPLLSYLDIRLQGFLPKGLTTSEARHLGPRLVRQDSLEPIRDGSRDNVFQGRAVYIPVEAPILEDPVAEALLLRTKLLRTRLSKTQLSKSLFQQT